MATADTSTTVSGRFLALLAVPALGLALAITTVTTYLPVLIADVSGPAVTGVLIGFEGALALVIPGVVGAYSDRVDTRFGRRLPFVLIGVPLMAIALVVMPLWSHLLPIAIALFVFYVGYFVCYAPYRAMYPDLVPEGDFSRSQGSQNAAREIGLGVALVSGGLLLSIGTAVPFVASAVILLAVSGVFAWRVRAIAVRSDARHEIPDEPTSLWRSWGLLRESKRIRRLLTANALWELSLGALKTFVVLFITQGIGRSSQIASVALAIVAIGVVAAALLAGRLATRFGHRRLLTWAATVYAIGLVVPIFVHSLLFLIALLPLAFAAGIVMTLPYALMMDLMPDADHGAGAGAFEASRGAGVVLGPVLAGIAVEVLHGLFESTDGYAAMFMVAAIAVFASIPLVRRAVPTTSR